MKNEKKASKAAEDILRCPPRNRGFKDAVTQSQGVHEIALRFVQLFDQVSVKTHMATMGKQVSKGTSTAMARQVSSASKYVSTLHASYYWIIAMQLPL